MVFCHQQGFQTNNAGYRLLFMVNMIFQELAIDLQQGLPYF